MRRLIRKCLLAVGATTTAVVLVTTSPAWAHPTWTVRVAGFSAPSTPITGTNVGYVTATNTTSGVVFSCPSATAGGTIKIGTGLVNPLAKLGEAPSYPPDPEDPPVGGVRPLTFGGAVAPHADKCNGPTGSRWKLTIDWSSTPLALHVLAHASPMADVVTGELRGNGDGIRATLDVTDGCHATLGGPNAGGAGGVLPVKFTNSTDRLTTTTGGNLRVLTVSNSCDPYLIEVGDLWSLAATYALNKNVTITD